MIDILYSILPHVGTIIGFGLAFVLIARLMREKRRPSNTIAWLLVIVLVPYVGVPLYLILGGRKISRLTQRKSPLNIAPENASESIVSSSPFGVITTGNRTQFQHTGIQAFESLVNNIRNATESIQITTFILSHDAIGRRIVKELSARARQGVEVRLLLDAVGSFGKKTLYMRELEKAGGKIERFMPVFSFPFVGKPNLRNHRKIAIFDGKAAIIGGRNIGRDYMGPVQAKKRWKDFSVQIEGPAVRQLSEIFEADWAFAQSKSEYTIKEPASSLEPVGDSKIEIMASGPDTKADPLYEKIISAIHDADHEILIATPYFIPDEVLLRTLIVKARTGKRVRLVIPKKSNHKLADLARTHYLKELHEAGVEVLLYRAGMMHGKAMLVDKEIAMTGSANIDLRSLFVNYEVGAFFYGDEDITDVKSWIQMLIAECDSFEEVAKRKSSPIREMIEDLSRLLAPLL